MDRFIPPSTRPTLEPKAVELCLRLGNTIFGVYFTDLTDARDAARHINLTGRDVEIFEKNGGRVVEFSKGVAINPLKQPVPPDFVGFPEVAVPADPKVEEEPGKNQEVFYG